MVRGLKIERLRYDCTTLSQHHRIANLQVSLDPLNVGSHITHMYFFLPQEMREMTDQNFKVEKIAT